MVIAIFHIHCNLFYVIYPVLSTAMVKVCQGEEK